MSYFYRSWLMSGKRERISCANPYHDELGRFTTADNAVMFVRPRAGYFDGKNTPDEAWRGSFENGQRFDARRVRNGAAAVEATPAPSAGYAALAAPPSAMGTTEPGATAGLSQLARQMATNTSPEPYPNPEVEAFHAPTPAGESSFTTLQSSVVELAKSTNDLHDVAEGLRSKGFSVDRNWDGGVNASMIIEAPDGQKYQLKHATDTYGLGAYGEGLAGSMIRELGINVRTQEAAYVVTQGRQEFALTEWVSGNIPQGMTTEQVAAAIDNTGREEVIKLIMFEALAGDSDKHRANYVISDDNKIVGMDYSRMGDYNHARGSSHGFQSVLLNSMSGEVSTLGMADFLKQAKAVVEREVIARTPIYSNNGRKVNDDGSLMFETAGRAVSQAELDKRYSDLLSLVSRSSTVDVSLIQGALTSDRKLWSYKAGRE